MEKGTIVRANKTDSTAIVLAVTRDGKRAHLHIHGYSDCGTRTRKIGHEPWVDIDKMTVVCDGDETCHKCNGSGEYHHGGAVVNGVYTGQILRCNACAGKGTQNNADRIRCHHYWQNYRIAA